MCRCKLVCFVLVRDCVYEGLRSHFVCSPLIHKDFIIMKTPALRLSQSQETAGTHTYSVSLHCGMWEVYYYVNEQWSYPLT